MEFLTLMIWGVEDGVPFIPEPAQPEPELVIADEETELHQKLGKKRLRKERRSKSPLHPHLVFLLK
ncbi:unnamed protein product [Meloidogyne enterolobii]|uniref:Uncharacterized protein n=1 Tax=Meloidogyne enterolobii TaxID=390850 RepID=A0ACB0XNG2_MELEN